FLAGRSSVQPTSATAGERPTWQFACRARRASSSEGLNVLLPKPLVMFLAFCGGAALFATPILLGAIALGAGDGNEQPGAEQPAPAETGEPRASEAPDS